MRRRSTVYHDSSCGQVAPVADDSLFFLDALQEEEDEEEYPIVTTAYVLRPPHRVSIAKPETLLRRGEEDKEVAVATTENAPFEPRRPSFVTTFRRGSESTRKSLEKNAGRNIVERGYPGELTSQELDECINFYRQVESSSTFREIVYSYSPMEDEPYALCRFMRSTKFNSAQMLERLDNGATLWNEAKAHDFYPNAERAIGSPLPLFLQMYPFRYFGNAKNGCPVSYFNAGKINTEGLLCLTTIDQTPGFYWHQYVHAFKDCMRRAIEKNPDFCRCEAISVIDLKGLSSSQFNPDAMAIIKKLGKITEFFPETLHCLIVMNAPSWFAMAWKVIKNFVDARTAKKIEIYSKTSSGQARLLELVDAEQVPSDFGGTGQSTKILNQGNKKYFVQVVHVKKKHTCTVTDMFELKDNESASIHVHTRSVSGALVSVFNDSKMVANQVNVTRSEATMFSEENPPMPYSTEVLSSIAGPGKISIHLELVDSFVVEKKMPHGHFLVAADVVRSVQAT